MFSPNGQTYYIMSIFIFFIAIVCLHMAGIYRSWRMGLTAIEMGHLFSGCCMVYVLFFITAYFLKISSELSRLVMILWMIIWPMFLLGERLLFRTFLRYQRQKGRNIRTCIIAGAGDLGCQLARWIENNHWAGTKLIGFFDDKATKPIEGYPVLDNLEAIPSYIRENRVDIVYLTLPMRAESKIQQLVAALADSTVSVYI